MAYATSAELATYTGLAAAALPADVDRMLERASERVDAALVAAVYDVNGAGDPTDADVAAALRDATSAIVEAWIVSDDEHGQLDGYASVSLGSLTLNRGNARGGAAPAGAKLPERAVDHLRRAGLLPGWVFT